MSADNLRCNLNNLGDDFRQSRTENSALPATRAISAFLGYNLCSPGSPVGKLVSFFSLNVQSPLLGRQNRESPQSRATVSAILAILPLSAFLASPATAAVSTRLADILGNLCLQVRPFHHSQQPRQSQHFWESNSAVPAIPSGKLVSFFSLSVQSPIRSWTYR